LIEKALRYYLTELEEKTIGASIEVSHTQSDRIPWANKKKHRRISRLGVVENS